MRDLGSLKKRFAGIGTATIIPFTKDDKVNTEEYGRFIDWIIEGAKGRVSIINPFNVELNYLSDAERRQVLKTLVKHAGGKTNTCTIITGAGRSMSTANSIENGLEAKDIGIDVVKLTPPTVWGIDLTPDHLYHYFEEIINAVGLPAIIYNNIRRMGTGLTPELVVKLADNVENFVILEDPDIYRTRECIARAKDKLLFFGYPPDWVPFMAIGCDGFYSHYFWAPEQMFEIYDACVANDFHKATAAFYKYYDSLKLVRLGLDPEPTVIKFCLNTMKRFDLGETRGPYIYPPEPQNQKLYIGTLKRYGLLK